MSISEHLAVRVAPFQSLEEAMIHRQGGYLDEYLEDAESDYLSVGTVLLVPTYRLEEAEEIVEPEKPGVPVEPYVGLSWEYGGTIQTAVGRDIAGHWIVVYFQDAVPASGLTFLEAWDITLLGGYPRTPSTPAVTRKVKKWVKIDPPEVSFDGLA